MAIIILTSLVYVISLSNGWTNWDDGVYVLDNDIVKNFAVSQIATDYVAGNYHPLTVFFLSLEYQLFGESATGYHAISLLIHLINSLLVFFFARRLTKNNIAGFVAGLLFGIHPLHVESVSWISAQKDLLYSSFYIVAMFQYLKYAEEPEKDWKKYAIVISLFILALLSKAQAVTLPIVLVLIDWFRGTRISLRTQVNKIPLFALALLFGIVAIVAQKQVQAIQDMTYFSWPERILLSSYAIVFYLGKLVVPTHLSTYYPYPTGMDGKFPAIVYVAPVIVLLLALVIYRFGKKSRILIFGSLFFLITILPVLQLLPVGGAIAADRYSYISFTGWFLIIGVSMDWIWKQRAAGKPFAIPMLAILFGWLMFLSVTTFNRSFVWKNSGTLFEDLVSKYDNVDIAYNNLGWYYLNENKYELAKKNFDRALELHPDFVNALINRYTVLKKLGKDDSALIDARRLIALKPDLPGPYLDRGVAYGIAGKTDSALIDFKTVLSSHPEMGEAYMNIGNIYFMKAMYDSSISNYNHALKAEPTITGVYNPLAFAYMESGQLEKSLEAFDKAIAEDPADPNNFYGRMQAYEKLQQYEKAYQDAVTASQMGLAISTDYLQQLRTKANI